MLLRIFNKSVKFEPDVIKFKFLIDVACSYVSFHYYFDSAELIFWTSKMTFSEPGLAESHLPLATYIHLTS
jgi:hypothetical protein